jgi:hypothetical protein
MMGKVLASAVLGLSLLAGCSSDEPPPTGRGRFPTGPGPRAGSGPTMPPPATGTAGTTSSQGFSGTFGSNPPGVIGISGTGSFGQSGDGANTKADNCGSADIPTNRFQPTVWLVIDGSGSMADPLVRPADGMMAAAGGSRWDALRPALMDPMGGVVPTLEKLVKFGMVMYDGPLGGFPGTGQTLPDGGPATGMPPTDECPRLVTVEPAINAFAALDPLIPALPPGGSTPTHKAMAQVLSHLPATTMLPDGTVEPTYVVLATDGAPNDYCGGMQGDPFGNGPDPVQEEVVRTTMQMQSQGIPVYVISLAADDQRLATHLNAVAAAGGTQKPPFTPMNKEDLVKTFLDIIGPEVGCTVGLTSGFGVMEHVACMGKVMLNGNELPCNDPNGWKLVDPKTIEIQGTACEEYKKQNNARLTANFPCELQQPG